MSGNPFWDYWYFQVPNYILAALTYTLLGRFLLSFFVPPDSSNYIWRFFRLLTDPILRVVAVITPRFMVDLFLPLVAAFWITLIRILFWLALFLAGVAPKVALDS